MYPDDPVLLLMWLAEVDWVLVNANSQEDFHHFAVYFFENCQEILSLQNRKRESIGIPMGRGLNAFNHSISWGILNRKVTPWSKTTRQYNELRRSDNDYGMSRFV